MSSESPLFKSLIKYLLNETTQELQPSQTSMAMLKSSGSVPIFITEIVYVKTEPGFPPILSSGVVNPTSLMGNLTEVLTVNISLNFSLLVEYMIISVKDQSFSWASSGEKTVKTIL